MSQKQQDENGTSSTPTAGGAGENPESGLAGTPSGLAEQPPPERRKLRARVGAARAAWRKFSVKLLLFRIIVYGTASIALLFGLAYAVSKLMVTPEFIISNIQEQVRLQTGGNIEVTSAGFDLLTGFQLKDVRYFPPKAGDTRGYANGGEVTPEPLAEFTSLNIGYSVMKMLAGIVHINAIKLSDPHFHLVQSDGKFNFESIVEYRKHHFPDPLVPVAEPAEDPDVNQASASGALLPFAPTLLYMPVNILVQNIGIEGLRLTMETHEAGVQKSILTFEGLTFDAGLHWHKKISRIWFNLASTFERPMSLLVREEKASGTTAESSIQSDQVRLRMAMIVRLSFENFQNIQLDVASRILEVASPVASYQDIGNFVRVRSSIDETYKTLSIEAIELDIADALKFAMSGAISLPAQNLDIIGIKLKQRMNLNLKNLVVLAKPFVPQLEAGGEINIDDLKIDGLFEPTKMAQDQGALQIPYVSGVIWLEDIFATFPDVGLSMEPISGDITLAAGPSLSGGGSQFDFGVDLLIPEASVRTNTPVGEIEAGTIDMNTRVTGRFLWPEMVAPILKINIEAEEVFSEGKKVPAVKEPLFVDIDAEGRQDLARLASSVNVELGELLEFTMNADCQARCTRVRFNTASRLESLRKIHGIAAPLAELLNLGDFYPTELSGTVDFQAALKGSLPDPLETPPEKILAAADLKYSAQMSISKLTTAVPFFDVKAKNIETRLLTSGNMQQQKVDFSQKFESVSLVLPPTGPGAEAMPISVGRFSLQSYILNSIEGAPDLARIMEQVDTEFETDLYVGKISVPVKDVLTAPLNDFQLYIEGKQEKLRDFKIVEVSLKVPDFGVSTELDADARIDREFKPESLRLALKTSINQSGSEKLPLGIKTSGGVDFRLKVSTDMKKADVDGLLAFDRFHVTMPAKEPDKPPLIVVEDIRGSIPFKQNVNIAEIMELATPKTAPAAVAVQAGPAVASVQAAGAEQVPKVSIPDDSEGSPKGKFEKQFDSVVDAYFGKNQDRISEHANVIAMVDYNSVRPFFPERTPLSIKKIEVANLEVSRMEFDIELRQNWFALNQYVINFLGGKIQGDLQVYFEKLPRVIKTSVHMTRLDTRKLIERFPNLKGKASSSTLFSNPFVDGTVHLGFDLVSNEMSGGIEITSIGKDQMRMMLYYVDPFEENPTITDIRKALAFGDVRQVSIPIKNGEIGMDVDVRVLGAPFPTPRLSRFPISQVIQNFRDQSTNKAETSMPEAVTATGGTSGG